MLANFILRQAEACQIKRAFFMLASLLYSNVNIRLLPPCGVLMHPLPQKVEFNGKGQPLLSIVLTPKKELQYGKRKIKRAFRG